jgi:hypothetical protein
MLFAQAFGVQAVGTESFYQLREVDVVRVLGLSVTEESTYG